MCQMRYATVFSQEKKKKKEQSNNNKINHLNKHNQNPNNYQNQYQNARFSREVATFFAFSSLLQDALAASSDIMCFSWNGSHLTYNF